MDTQHINIAIAIASTLVQLTTALLALRLIPLTKKRMAWSLISCAIIVQGLRRVLSVIVQTGEMTGYWATGLDEGIGLLISLLLLAGVALIRPLFHDLQRSEERYRTVADFTYDMEYWRLPDGTFQYLSPSCLRVSGHSAEEYLKNPNLIFDIVHPDDKEMVHNHLRRDDEEQLPGGRLDYRIVLPSGEVRWLAHACQPVFADDGTYLGRRGSNRDITPRKLAEARKDDVEHILRHDIKSPLMGIIGIPQMLLQQDDVSEQTKKLLRHVEKAGLNLMNMMESSLALSRLERGETITLPEQVNLVELVAECFAGMEKEARAGNVTLVCTVHGAPAAPDARFEYLGELVLLRSMLGNLIKNGVEASSKGSTVTVDLRRDEQCLIAIHNDGLVPESIRETIFEKYVSAGKSHGTGLGTYSARLVARAHGGDLTFISSPDEGTTFTVQLPISG